MRAMSKSICVLAVVALTDELLPPINRSLKSLDRALIVPSYSLNRALIEP
jgi:hypothetical protein